MNKRNLVLKIAVAAALGLGSIDAYAAAATLANANASTFATEGIPASGAVTINGGIVYTSTTGGGTGDTGLLTFTLPAGVTFASTPTVTADGTNFSAATVGGGGAGSNTLTINVTDAGNPAQGTVTLGAFQITGATALASPTGAGAFEITAQGSGYVTDTAENDATPLKVDLAQSAHQLVLTPAANALVVDVAGKNGINWVANAGKGTARSGLIGTLVVNDLTYRNAANSGAYTFTSNTASATLTGNFSGISSAYIDPGVAACATTAPAGATTGTVTATSISFSGIAPSATARNVCLVNDNTSLLPANANLSVSATQDSTTISKTAALGPISLNGTAVKLNYVTGSTSGGYVNYFRVTNQTGSAARIIVVVTTDAGVQSTGTLDTGLAANTNKLYTVADINTAAGTSLSSATDRATITFLSPQAITVNNLLFNPNGTLTNMP